MSKKPLSILVRSLAVAGLGLALSQPAMAQGTVTIKFADWMPLSHPVSAEGGTAFMKKVAELSGGKIDLKFYPAEQLGKAKDSLQLAQTGVADIVNIAPAYITEKFPLSAVAELPGIYEGACNGTYALAKLTQPGQPLYEAEMKQNGVRILFTTAIGAYRIFTANKKIQSANDFKGMKLRTAGGPMDQTAASIGAVSIRMPGPDVLVSLNRGTLDGLFWPLQSIESWGLMSSVKYWTPNLGVGSFVIFYAISDRTWKKLSPENQKILTEAGNYATKHLCEFIDKNEEATSQKLQAHGIQPVPLPDADAKAISQGYGGIQNEWAESLEKRGRPGKQVLQAFKTNLPK